MDLIAAPHLEVIETVHSIKLAQKLENALINNFEGKELKIMVQVNTSNEPSKDLI
jgi:alanine racemase, N-terminal domain